MDTLRAPAPASPPPAAGKGACVRSCVCVYVRMCICAYMYDDHIAVAFKAIRSYVRECLRVHVHAYLFMRARVCVRACVCVYGECGCCHCLD